MFTKLYEKTQTKTEYDHLREYCLLEGMNEEHLRAIIRKENDSKRKSNPFLNLL